MCCLRVFRVVLMISSFTVGVSSPQRASPSHPRVELRAAEALYAEGLTEAVVGRTGDKVYVHKKAAATEKDILSCHFGVPAGRDGQRDLIVPLTAEGADAVAEATTGEKRVALLLDGSLVAAQLVNVAEGYCIFPGFSLEEARRVADAIDLACIQALIGDRGDVTVELRLAHDHPAKGLTEAFERITRRKVYLSEERLISNTDVLGARVVKGYTEGVFDIEVMVTPVAAARIERITEGNIGEMLAEVVGGRVVSAGYIVGKWSNPLQIYGDFTKEEADIIANAINARGR